MRHSGETHILHGRVEQTSGPFACVVRLSTGYMLALPVAGEVGDDVGVTVGVYQRPKPPETKVDMRGAPSRPGGAS